MNGIAVDPEVAVYQTGGVSNGNRRRKYSSLDTFRGVACLMVVIYHSTLYAVSHPDLVRERMSISNPSSMAISLAQRFWIGVPIFFVISGYCISASAESTWRQRRSTLHYFFKRVRRIYPPYWTFLALGIAGVLLVERLFGEGFVTGGALADPRSLSPWQWLGNLTLTESWRYHVIGPARMYLFGPIWTLCYEEQFYVVVGVMLIVAGRRFFLLSSVISAACVALLFSGRAVHLDGFFLDGNWLLFAGGILVYWRAFYARTTWQVTTACAVFLIVAVYSARDVTALFSGASATFDRGLLVAAAFGLMITLLYPRDAAVSDIRMLAPIKFCGIMCYSLYLLHWPIVKTISRVLWDAGVQSDTATVLITVPICTACSVAAAAVFHIVVERRFMSSIKPLTAAKPAIVASVAAR